MVAKKGGLGKGLGKGLDALIPEDSSRKVNTKPKKEVSVEKVIKKEEVMVKISDVEPNREQPRKSFDEDALLELSESQRHAWIEHHNIYKTSLLIMLKRGTDH